VCHAALRHHLQQQQLQQQRLGWHCGTLHPWSWSLQLLRHDHAWLQRHCLWCPVMLMAPESRCADLSTAGVCARLCLLLLLRPVLLLPLLQNQPNLLLLRGCHHLRLSSGGARCGAAATWMPAQLLMM
jgi:hypothetical protein